LTVPAIGYRALLRENPEFRRLWFAEVVSFLGDFFNTIALYAAVEQLSSGTLAFSAVFVAKLLPVFLMTPVSGPLIDRVDRRKLMIVTDVARAACALGLVVAYRAESLVLLTILLVVMVCFSGIFIPTKTAVIPQVTQADHLGAANALSAATWSVMLALGAAAGGVVTALMGIETALIFDALTFLISAALLVPLPPLLPQSQQDERFVDRSFVAGLRYLAHHRYLSAIIALKPCLALGGGVLALLPVFATRVFGEVSGPGAIGLLYTARGLGALVGSLAVRKVFGDAPATMRRLISPAFLVVALSWLALSQAVTIWHAGAAYFFSAVGGGSLWVVSGTLGQLESDNAYRGRVFAVEWGALTLVMSVMAGVGGVVVERYGWSARDVALASAVLLALPALLWIGVIMAIRPVEAER
jgi:MFS family permease